MSNIHCDGHLDGPNTLANIGYTKLVVDDGVSKTTKIITYQRPNLTNNEAELIAIGHAIALAKSGDTIYSDSEWSILAIEGAYRVKEERLSLMVTYLSSIIKFKSINLSHVKRLENLAT